MTAKERAVIEVGSVVQIDPAIQMFGGAFMVVTEIKSWGLQGYCHPLREDGGLAFFRVNHGEYEYIGHAVWIREEKA